MIDFHSHILPGIDDGSKDITETKELLRIEAGQGVDCIVATPHFYAGRHSIARFLEKRRESYAEVKALLECEDWIPDIQIGAEVYYFSGMGKAQQLRELCIGKTPLILIELPFCQWTEEIYRDVKDTIERQKLTVILAHVERYYEFQKDKTIWNAMFELPLYAQINAGSFIPKGIFHKKKSRFCFAFVQEGHPVLLGSDCHNTTSRKPNLASGRAEILRRLGEPVLQQMDDLAEGILERNAKE